MSSSSESRTSAFYDSIAASYDARLGAPEARRHRECFREVVVALLPSHARLLDFGAAGAQSWRFGTPG